MSNTFINLKRWALLEPRRCVQTMPFDHIGIYVDGQYALIAPQANRNPNLCGPDQSTLTRALYQSIVQKPNLRVDCSLLRDTKRVYWQHRLFEPNVFSFTAQSVDLCDSLLDVYLQFIESKEKEKYVVIEPM